MTSNKAINLDTLKETVKETETSVVIDKQKETKESIKAVNKAEKELDKRFKTMTSNAHNERVRNIMFSNVNTITHEHAHKHINRTLSCVARVCNDKQLKALYDYYHTTTIKIVNDKSKSSNMFRIINKLDSKAMMQYVDCVDAFNKKRKIKIFRSDAINQFNTSMTSACRLTFKQFTTLIKKYK